MSCEDSRKDECAEVLAAVWLFLDHECDQARRAVLAQHLDRCQPCLVQYGIDETLKRLLAAKCGGEHAPPELKDRLRQQIRVAMLTQVTVESGPDGTTVEVRATRVEHRD